LLLSTLIIIIIIIIIQFKSVEFSGYLLTCRLNSTSAYYKASTKTQIKHQNIQIHRNKTLNRQNESNIAEKINIMEVLGQKPYTVKKHR
jgi:hypothetical protein